MDDHDEDEEPTYEVYDPEEEREEARRAGKRALDSLRVARKSLGKASGWGLADIFGGNLVTGALKHANLQDARQAMSAAKDDLHRFAAELGDIPEADDLGIDVDGLLTFADFFFDGAIADVVVQSRIEKAKGEVGRAIKAVGDALDRLG